MGHCCSQDISVESVEESPSTLDKQLALQQLGEASLAAGDAQATAESSSFQPQAPEELGSSTPASTAPVGEAPDPVTIDAAAGHEAVPGDAVTTDEAAGHEAAEHQAAAAVESAAETSLAAGDDAATTVEPAPAPLAAAPVPTATTKAASAKEKAKAKPKTKTKPKPKPKPAATEAKPKDLAGMLDSALAKGFKQLLPNKLVWAPDTEQLAESPENITLFQLSDTKADPFLNGGTFNITHYAPSSYGAAVGPPSVCQFMRFCQLLGAKIAAKEDECVVFGTPKGDVNVRKNAAVLIGGYLIVQHTWTATGVAKLLADEANNTFPCPWYTPEAKNMTVKDCWSGFDMAVNQGWIYKADVMSETACKAYMTLAETYDANWLAPGHVIVSADPMSTVMDPNPKTVQALGNTPKGWVGRKQEAEVGDFNFLCWSKNANIGLVVRANFSTEPGLREIGGSYDSKAFTSRGISQLDAAVDDVKGGVPDVRSISKVLDGSASCTQEKRRAVLIHCKAGFGRSVVYAACLLIHKFDVPGSSILGWIRMCRPGSITTPDQEKFLQKLSGRKDLEKLLPSAKSGGGRMFGKMFK